METQKTALNVAGVVFLIVAVVHLLRVLLKWQITVENFTVPGWYSLVGFLVAFSLSLWMFKSVR